MLFSLFAGAWRICLFRQGPQDLPAAREAVTTSVVLALVANMLQFQLSLPLLAAAGQSVVAVLVVWVYTSTVLAMRKLPERTPQTASALLLTNTIFTVLLIPFLMPLLPAMEQLAEEGAAAEVSLPAVPMLGVLALSLWSLAVAVWVFRNAMDTRNPLAILATLGMAAMVWMVAGSVGVLLAGA